MAAEVDAEVGASIADRLAALQESGTSGWRKRVPRLNPERDLLGNNGVIHHNNLNNNHVEAEEGKQPQPPVQAPAPAPEGQPSTPPDVGGLLSERLGRLDAASQDWRKRVGPSDAVQFSVAGRMHLTPRDLRASPALARARARADADADAAAAEREAGAGPAPEFLSPLMARLSVEGAGDRQKKKPRPLRFRAKTAQLKEAQSTPSSPQKEPLVTLKRSVSAPEGDENGVQTEESSPTAKVAIPRPDDETFTQFYSSISTEKLQLQQQRLEINDTDLDNIVSQTTSLLVQKRSVKIQRRKFTSRNPIKSLQARTDLRDEYEEVKIGVADKELKRLRVEQLAKHSSLAVEALAGLASKEDFTAVQLKKAVANSSAMLPYQDLMLLLIKGRRHVQTRLVEPVASSINSGDNYVLVTPTEVFNWVGRYSNVIERSRGAEVALHILQHKDLGCTSASQVTTISEEKPTCSLRQQERFWKLLGSDSKTVPINAGHPDEDELFETSVIATNMIYEVQGEELVPMEEFWGSIPRISMLDPAKILVFDFGSELYVWNGKNAPVEARRQAQRLARELWDEGYDYSECDVCPLNVSSSLGSRSVENDDTVLASGSNRPNWSLLARVTQHMETILFREKFLDWPDFSRVIRTKGSEENEKQLLYCILKFLKKVACKTSWQTETTIDVKPCDAKEMLKPNTNDPDLVLENTHLGRGNQFFDEETHRHYEISTIGVSVWHIQEYESSQLPSISVGQFHSEDSYVVRWQYSVTVTGRELSSGQPSRHSVVGRDRCAYFFWQGQNASINEQGAAALLTVELDREHGPQVRAVEGTEPPAFLRLFDGGMTVHSGHRESEPTTESKHEESWKLFLCRGERVEEAVLVQVACSTRHFRSRAGLVLLNTSTGVLYVWYGAKASQNTCKVTRKAAEKLKTSKAPEYGIKSGVAITIHEEHEGEESKEFMKGLGGSNRHLYVSLTNHLKPLLHSPRLFHFSSVSGNFTATEILGPYRQIGETVAYPFLQSDLYSASQPALFLLDNDTELWLWQGWWPYDSEDQSLDSSIQTGSGAVRWQAERRAAMQTALDYWHLSHTDHKASTNVPAFLVWAGLEPLQFTNLFPMWTDRDDIAEINIRDGKKPGEVLEVEMELARLTRSTYPPAQLLQRPLPDGVDPTRLELYLEPHHFQELLGMSKEEFMELPSWKQTNIKKEVGLF
ncbi:hypothetical protein R5R35_005791 [Gryllus longicercus]|uniref:HP domain-containing protein n=1 Tax=Gryllus longicercus TaxID=2509291 RepID=A0AAN9Z9V4_9ORTH